MTTDKDAVLHDALATLNTVDQSPAWRAERGRCIARIKHALGMKLETWQTAILLAHGYIGKDDEPVDFSKPATEENPMASHGWTAEEERIGWAIVTGLHSNVPEDKRPSAWMNLDSEQTKRIRTAAQLVIMDWTPAPPKTEAQKHAEDCERHVARIRELAFEFSALEKTVAGLVEKAKRYGGLP